MSSYSLRSDRDDAALHAALRRSAQLDQYASTCCLCGAQALYRSDPKAGPTRGYCAFHYRAAQRDPSYQLAPEHQRSGKGETQARTDRPYRWGARRVLR